MPTPEQFFAGVPDGLAIHDAVLEAVRSHGPVTERVSRSQIALHRPGGAAVAYLWWPGRYVRSDVPAVLSLPLRSEDPSPRVKEVAHPAEHVWMHHVELTAPADLQDPEVRRLLGHAWEEAGPLLAHDDAGAGPAVLLLHAGIADRRMWDHQRAALVAAGFRVVSVDLPGYGGTPPPVVAVDEAAEVLRVLDRSGVASCAVVGASYGGAVGLVLATRHAGRVRALVLVDPAADLLDPGPALQQVWRREAELMDAGDVEGIVELTLHTWLGPDAGEDVRTLVAIMQRRAAELQLAGGAEPVEVDADPADVAVPTLVIVGEHDLPEFRDLARALAETVPAAVLTEIADAGHLPSLEQPVRTSAAVTDFLVRHHPPASRPGTNGRPDDRPVSRLKDADGTTGRANGSAPD